VRRKVWCLSNEGQPNHENPLTLWRYRDGTKEDRLLARTHSHGNWIEWLA
jgi:hypothetical protein